MLTNAERCYSMMLLHYNTIAVSLSMDLKHCGISDWGWAPVAKFSIQHEVVFGNTIKLIKLDTQRATLRAYYTQGE